MRKLLFLSFVITIAALLIGTDAEAQCAMCKAVVESNQKHGGGIGAGLNSGILYLMAIPYAMVFGGGYFWYRQLKERAKLES
ncbi:MAG: hypothetical protein COB85_02085 [Bacteroidetes bacterium]|nr:MAG: hypothetical protein COB85_02085 [Bacteroidota bacterium]